MSNTDGLRLKEWRRNKGLSQRELATVLGRSQGYVGNIEAGTTGFSRDLIARLLERTTANLAWLLTGTGPMDVPKGEPGFPGRHGEVVQPPDYDRPAHGDVRIDDQEFTLIRRYEINVSAGPGIVPIEGSDGDYLAFSTSWVSRHGLNSDLSGLVRVKGDSMAPTIPDGALVLVHLPEMFVKSEGIYAYSRNGEAFIKRLVPVGVTEDHKPAALVIVSDNPSYAPETILGEALNEIRVVGRIRSVLTSF